MLSGRVLKNTETEVKGVKGKEGTNNNPSEPPPV